MFRDSPSHRSGTGGKGNIDYRTTWATFRVKTHGLVTSAVVLLALVPSGALAHESEFLPDSTPSKVQFGAGARYATAGLGLGFGGRAGFAVPKGLYLGVSFDYFLGSSRESLAAIYNKRSGFWNLDGEFGYDMALTGALSIRPNFRLGLARNQHYICGPVDTTVTCFPRDTSNAVDLQLGGVLSYDVGNFWFSGDARVHYADDLWTAIIGCDVGVAF